MSPNKINFINHRNIKGTLKRYINKWSIGGFMEVILGLAYDQIQLNFKHELARYFLLFILIFDVKTM